MSVGCIDKIRSTTLCRHLAALSQNWALSHCRTATMRGIYASCCRRTGHKWLCSEVLF